MFPPPKDVVISIFLLKRFATFIATLLAASAVIFAVLDVLPGSAAEVMLGDSATPESLKALEIKLGLDRPPSNATPRGWPASRWATWAPASRTTRRWPSW